jgi:hypothetical protein
VICRCPRTEDHLNEKVSLDCRVACAEMMDGDRPSISVVEKTFSSRTPSKKRQWRLFRLAPLR